MIGTDERIGLLAGELDAIRYRLDEVTMTDPFEILPQEPRTDVSSAEVLARDNGKCQRCGSARATDVHHRKFRSRGGLSSWDNLISLCRACHRWAQEEDEPTATAEGWDVASWDDPSTVPIAYYFDYAGRVLLDPDGSVIQLGGLP